MHLSFIFIIIMLLICIFVFFCNTGLGCSVGGASTTDTLMGRHLPFDLTAEAASFWVRLRLLV
jgi:hypothetical protein